MFIFENMIVIRLFTHTVHLLHIHTYSELAQVVYTQWACSRLFTQACSSFFSMYSKSLPYTLLAASVIYICLTLTNDSYLAGSDSHCLGTLVRYGQLKGAQQYELCVYHCDPSHHLINFSKCVLHPNLWNYCCGREVFCFIFKHGNSSNIRFIFKAVHV